MAHSYISRSELLKRIRAFVAEHESQRVAATALGISKQHLHEILAGTREIGPKTAAGLGFVVEAPKYRKMSA